LEDNPAIVPETATAGQVNDLKVSDELWDRIRPLLPVVQRRRRWPGRKPMDDRACLNGILFVLATGIGWERLPQQLGYGSGMTCWRRLRDWQAAGVWHRLHALLLAELRAAGRLELTRAIADSAHVRALKGGRPTGPKPGRPGPGRLQASHPDRRNRHTAGGHPDRRQSQRRHATGPAPGRGPTNPRSRRSPTPQAQHAGR
jgi:transposase